MSDEHGRFVAWAKGTGQFTDLSRSPDDSVLRGEFLKPRVELCWKAWDARTAERDALLARVAHLTAALEEIRQTPIVGNHGKLQAIGMRATASIALEADAKSLQAKPDFSMIATPRVPPMEYDEP